MNATLQRARRPTSLAVAQRCQGPSSVPVIGSQIRHPGC